MQNRNAQGGEPADPQSNDADATAIVLAVDLDGTLLLTDTLFEALSEHLRRRPFWALWQLIQLPFGIAKVKDRLTTNVAINVDLLPVNEDVLTYCRSAKDAGREVWLVSAADQKMVDRIAARFDVFDRAIGSNGETNNKGSAKARLLEKEAPEGFEYVGDSPADFAVWKKAARASHVDKGASRRRAIERMGVEVSHSFDRPGAGVAAWIKAMRIHQWVKNVLIFVPAILAMQILDYSIFVRLIVAFPLIGLLASGTYILNDLLDLQADRAHRSKRNRPFAAGRLKLWQGFVAAPVLILIGLTGGFLLSPAFAAAQVFYLVAALAYSFMLRRAALADAMTLGALYTLRLIMGAALANVALSQWLLVFSMFLFVSLSLAKRHTELLLTPSESSSRLTNRGYCAKDAGLTLALGASAATMAPLLLTLYIIDSAWPLGIYQSPETLWAAPVLLGLWLMRIWLLANRGELHDDPIMFAVRDPYSLLIGAGMAVAFLAAVLLPSNFLRALTFGLNAP